MVIEGYYDDFAIYETLTLGFSNVKIIVSDRVGEEVRELRDMVDAFGVGTAIAGSVNIDISADIVEVEEDGA